MKDSLYIISVSPPSEPVKTTVKVPGSKSYSQRALMISALCGQEFKIKNLLQSNDTHAMETCISSLKTGSTEIRIKESGLTARFMTALACLSPGSQTISGTTNLEKRPIKDLVDALRQLGADIEYLRKDGFLPLKVNSSQLTGREVRMKGDTSSQYLSALLLLAPVLPYGLDIRIEGEQISKPYIDMTIDIMGHFGVEIENKAYKHYEIKPQVYRAKDYTVEGDYSSAAYFYAFNRLSGSDIVVENLNDTSLQGDKKFVDLIKDGDLPARINAGNFPDQAMTLAVLAAFETRRITIENIASLRIKETERVLALENELAKMGIRTESTEDTLTIYGDRPKVAMIDTYGDHRIAMSFAIAGSRIPDIQIMHPEVVNKTFPGFWDELGKMTRVRSGKKRFSNILLIGMRGSGKTTIGKLLAERLGKDLIDMDVYLEKKHGRKVRDIVLENGWDYFRKLESEACQKLAKRTDCVISSGGGIVLDQKNMERFKDDSVSVLLKADPRILSQRIRDDNNRPELSTQPSLIGELGEVWEKRKDKYYKNAHFIIDTTDISPKQAVDEIMEKI